MRSYKKRMKLFPKIREAKAKVQYEWLTERHVIRLSDKFFPFGTWCDDGLFPIRLSAASQFI